jgi:hypothetical protein
MRIKLDENLGLLGKTMLEAWHSAQMMAALQRDCNLQKDPRAISHLI